MILHTNPYHLSQGSLIGHQKYLQFLTSDANYKAVHKKIVEKGYGGVKAYFAATLKKSGDLQINLAETCAETF